MDLSGYSLTTFFKIEEEKPSFTSFIPVGVLDEVAKLSHEDHSTETEQDQQEYRERLKTKFENRELALTIVPLLIVLTYLS